MVFGVRRRGKGQQGSTGKETFPAIPAGAGLLSFEVRDERGAPVAAAEISATDEASGRSVTLGRSDPFGMVAVSTAPGQYRMSVSAEGYQTQRVSAEARSGTVSSPGPVTLESAVPPELPSPGYWEIDPSHTAVRFIAQHIGMAQVHGRFENFVGAFHMAQRLEDSWIQVAIDSASINTGTRMRDDHLRSSDFLDVEKYPQIHFNSERFVHRGGTKWTIHGTLTLHGVSRAVRMDTNFLGVGVGMEDDTRAACFASTELHREDYTLNWRKMLAAGIAAVGSTIRIELDVQAVYQGLTPPETWR